MTFLLILLTLLFLLIPIKISTENYCGFETKAEYDLVVYWMEYHGLLGCELGAEGYYFWRGKDKIRLIKGGSYD